MQLQLETPHIEATEKLESLVRNKLKHLGKRYDRISYCHVVMRKNKSDIQKDFFVDVKMAVPGKILFASDNAESYEIALDKVTHDLEHQLRRYKEELDERR